MTEQPADQPPATHTSTEVVNSAPGSSGVSRLWRRTAGAAAVVAVLVIGNATVNAGSASASTRLNSTTATVPVTGTATVSSSGASHPGTDGSAPADAALHGEFKVINRDGSAQLRRWQSGSVNAIDEISLTVRSADGFDSTYLLGPGVSVTGIDIGDEVTVVGAGQSVAAGAEQA